MNQRILLTMGDYNGIGPEIILKSFDRLDKSNTCFVVLGNISVFHFYKSKLQLNTELKEISALKESDPGSLNVLNVIDDRWIDLEPGSLTAEAGKACMVAVRDALDLCLKGDADALVTAPISKEAIQLAGFDFPGHTEFLAANSGSEDFLMMLVNDTLRVALATIHVALSQVSSLIDEVLILKKLEILDSSLRNDFLINEPTIAVLGLNPHAGDGGVIGREELDIITPALQKASFNNISAKGPFPADSFFGSSNYKDFDAILACYHDQGLIPFKTLSFGKGVNYTAGLPIIRTSPDHGTAYDIAGLNLAGCGSFMSAIKLAIQLANNRKTSKISYD